MLPRIGGMNPAQMQNLMKQFGIKSEEIPAKKVVFELDGKRLIIDSPSVTAVEVQGQKTYTVMGEVREEKGGAAGAASAGAGSGVSEEDVKMVAEQAKASAAKARKALKDADGDIAQAIMSLKK